MKKPEVKTTSPKTSETSGRYDRGDAAIIARANEARADYLREHGRDLRWSEIARRAGKSQDWASDISTLRRRLQVEEAPALAHALEVRTCWLVFNEGPKRLTEAERVLEALPSVAFEPITPAAAARPQEAQVPEQSEARRGATRPARRRRGRR